MSGRKGLGWLVVIIVVIAAGAAGFYAWRERIPQNVAYVTEEEGGVVVIAKAELPETFVEKK